MVTIAFIDIETTGLDPEEHEIIELAAVLVELPTWREAGTFDCRVRPEHLENASSEALRVNGYTEQAWAGALEQGEAICRFARFIDGMAVVGHNIGFDMQFIDMAIGRHIAPSERPRIGHRLDTMSMGWVLRVGDMKPDDTRYPSVSLDAMARLFAIDRPSPHRALDDARAAAQVAKGMATLLLDEKEC